MNISENSRVWIYQSDRILQPIEVTQIQDKLNSFTSQWLAHGHELVAAAEIRYNQFIVLSVDEEKVGATGCSIDKSVKLMKDLELEFSINLFDRFSLAYRDGEVVQTVNRDEFEKLLKAEVITSETIVFNNLVSTRKELNNSWEVPLKNTWHAQVFGSLILT
ncbi:MAG: ABC transporter ATPase [Flavobacterium sp.]|nr:ABC transporter ATPase [Pedobacter sp.]